ncbi:MAG: nucleotidyltransferase family protein [Methanolobus sp.]|nr:nucleotidyltransferase family protein [Methanolobus sp.]
MPAKKDIATYRQKLHEMLLELEGEYNVSYIGLFGSYVLGEHTSESDLDVLVEFSKTPTIFRCVHLENYLSDSLGVKVYLVMKDALKLNIGMYILNEVEAV